VRLWTGALYIYYYLTVICPRTVFENLLTEVFLTKMPNSKTDIIAQYTSTTTIIK
jgi:hypothetical protein